MKEYEYHPMSSMQRRLWFHSQLNPGSAAYNTARIWVTTGSLDVPRAEASLHAIVQRHEILRTVYDFVEEQPLQCVYHATEPSRITAIRCSAKDTRAELTRRLLEPFALETDFPIRAYLIDNGGERLLVFVIHHIAVDAWSLDRIMYEFGIFYNGGFAKAEGQYSSYCQEEAAFMDSDESRDELLFWQQVLSAPNQPLTLPYKERNGSMYDASPVADASLLLPLEASDALTQLQSKGFSRFVVVAAAVGAFFRRYSSSGTVDLLFTASTRPRSRVPSAIGCMTNTLVLRQRYFPGATNLEGLERTRRSLFESLDHARYPFDELVRRAGDGRGNKNAGFQISLDDVGSAGSFVLEGNTYNELVRPAHVTRNDIAIVVGALPRGRHRIGWIFDPGRLEERTALDLRDSFVDFLINDVLLEFRPTRT